MKIGGVDLPDGERVEIALTRVYGIGRSNVSKLIKLANINPDKRARQLSAEERGRIINALEKFKTEGDLRRSIKQDIERLRAIKAYRGIRHILGLPTRGQRTRTNARTRKGKRKTVGSLTKEMWAKLESQQRAASK